MGERLLEVAVLVARKAREKVKALFGAGGSDVQEARGLGVLGVGVEVLEVFVGEVLVGAGFLDGGQKQTPRTPLVRGAARRTTHQLLPQEQRRIRSSRSSIQPRNNHGVELEAL